MVLIPKGKGDYRGIGLVKVMWKVVTTILNLPFTASITYHDLLHGFKGRLRHRYLHPRIQTASEVSGLEEGGPVRDISGPKQGL